MIKISIDLGLCQGYGNCVSADPEIFDLNDSGFAFLHVEEVPDDRLSALRDAAAVCPVEAIRVEPDADGGQR